jgi:hypothetical protein
MELSAVMGATAPGPSCEGVRSFVWRYAADPTLTLRTTLVVLRLGSTADIEIDHRNVSRQRDTFVQDCAWRVHRAIQLPQNQCRRSLSRSPSLTLVFEP